MQPESCFSTIYVYPFTLVAIYGLLHCIQLNPSVGSNDSVVSCFDRHNCDLVFFPQSQIGGLGVFECHDTCFLCLNFEDFLSILPLDISCKAHLFIVLFFSTCMRDIGTCTKFGLFLFVFTNNLSGFKSSISFCIPSLYVHTHLGVNISQLCSYS